jgi:hypothetical protein
MKVEKQETTTVERKVLENGAYPARIYSVIDLGTQPQQEMVGGVWQPRVLRDFNTEEAILDAEGKEQFVSKRELNVSFEIPTELVKYEKDGEEVEFPFAVHKNYTVSLHEKAGLTKLVLALGLDIDAFDTDQLVGKTVLVTVGKTSGGKDKVTNVTSLPKGMEVEPAVNPPKSFDLEAFDQAVFDSLPSWQQDTINGSSERKDTPVKAVSPDEIDF